MNPKPKTYPILLIIVTFLPFATFGADMKETEIPEGWDLSASLALFRNLPFIDSSNFPKTTGEVFLLREVVQSQEGETEIFKNTYFFYRKAGDKFLQVKVTEEHQLGFKNESEPFHRVCDLEQQATTVDKLPVLAESMPELSKLLGYVFDHRETLIDSKAGEMARSLNYKQEGRERRSNYIQPRVTYTENAEGKIDKIFILGLAALLDQEDENAEVLEMSVDGSGAAKVALVPYSR